MATSGIVKKYKIAPFLNKGTDLLPDWVRIKKSTAFDLAMNPVTQEYDYIADESPTTELMQYKPSLSQALTMYKGEADYDLIFSKFFNLSTGDDAKSKILLVFFQESSGTGVNETFKAWQSDCVLSVTNLNGVESTITFDVAFGGTVKKGTVKITDGKPVFTETVVTP